MFGVGPVGLVSSCSSRDVTVNLYLSEPGRAEPVFIYSLIF